MVDDHQSIGAIIGAAIVTAAAAIWKIWFAVRKDARADASSAEIQGGYSAALKNLRDEVTRLAVSVADLSKALDSERRARYEAESRALLAERRAQTAETAVAELKAKVAAMGVELQDLRAAAMKKG